MYHNEKKYLLGNTKQDVEKNQKNLVGKNSDKKIVKNMLLRYTP